jgi:MFS family permease
MENVEEKQLFESSQRAIVVKSEATRRVKLIDLLPQFVASSLMYLCVIQAGVSMSISSVLISQLADGNEIQINTNQSSIIGSIFSIALPFGAITSGFLSDRFGRKKIGLYVCIPFFIAWVLIGISENVMTIYVSRIVAGICCGVTTASVVYTAEISYKTFRSALLCMNSVFVSFGIFLTYLLNYFHLNWHLIGWIYAAVSLLSMLLILLVPESTHWILFFNQSVTEEQKLVQLKKSLVWLYRDPAVSRN